MEESMELDSLFDLFFWRSLDDFVFWAYFVAKIRLHDDVVLLLKCSFDVVIFDWFQRFS